MKLSTYSYTKKDLKRMPARIPDSHKGTYGRLLCVCGAEGMCGAAYLCAKSAYRMGAGLVRILTPKENLIPLQTSLPEAIVSVYDNNSPDMHIILSSVEWADAIVIGCGLSRSLTAKKLLGTVLRSSKKPTVIDADALNIISENTSLKKYLSGNIITPHLLEASRLCGRPVSELEADRISSSYDIAVETGAVCVLKSHKTCVSDGSDMIYVNDSGNSGMATAGSGDVLAGIMGGILAQNRDTSLSLTEVASLAVYIHGVAGDLAAYELSEYSLMAGDIINALPSVMKEIM